MQHEQLVDKLLVESQGFLSTSYPRVNSSAKGCFM